MGPICAAGFHAGGAGPTRLWFLAHAFDHLVEDRFVRIDGGTGDEESGLDQKRKTSPGRRPAPAGGDIDMGYDDDWLLCRRVQGLRRLLGLAVGSRSISLPTPAPAGWKATPCRHRGAPSRIRSRPALADSRLRSIDARPAGSRRPLGSFGQAQRGSGWSRSGGSSNAGRSQSPSARATRRQAISSGKFHCTYLARPRHRLLQRTAKHPRAIRASQRAQ